MSALWINILTFAFVLGTIAVLWVVLMLCKYEHIIWKLGLFACMLLEGVGTILIFIPEYFKYAALARVAGVFFMVSAVCYVRYQKAEGWEMERVKRSDYLIRAGAALMVAGFIGTPFFSVLSTQQQVKTSQNGIVGLLLRIEAGINRLNNNLDREHEERMTVEARDSEERKQILAVVLAAKAQLDINSKFLKAPTVIQRGPILNVANPRPCAALPNAKPGKKGNKRISYNETGDDMYDMDGLVSEKIPEK